ncbi:MAG: MYG1 family protein [Verrucomicrobiales bacterium]|nr:MYG1 family protein [Verrucomicrobiales bacterium]
MTTIHQILTHPGGAHKDDLLACSLLVHLHQVPVVRKEPTRADLDDPGILVVDVGHEHDPARGNFDHHQFPKDYPPTCALSLVLQHLEIYDDAKKFCDWLEPAEWFDTRGPNETAKWLGVERDIISKTSSPIDITLLRRFAKCSELKPESPVWQMMNMIGEDLIMYLRELRSRLKFIDDHCEFWTMNSKSIGEYEVIFMPRTASVPDDASAGLGRYIEEQGKEDRVIALVYPDRRGEGFGLSRYNDDQRVDFSALEKKCDDVHFSHARGFVCKTSATGVNRLKELIQMAVDH